MARFKENELARLQINEREHRRKEIDKALKEVYCLATFILKVMVFIVQWMWPLKLLVFGMALNLIFDLYSFNW